jgi:hypothetical protein
MPPPEKLGRIALLLAALAAVVQIIVLATR